MGWLPRGDCKDVYDFILSAPPEGRLRAEVERECDVTKSMAQAYLCSLAQLGLVRMERTKEKGLHGPGRARYWPTQSRIMTIISIQEADHYVELHKQA
jgi:predicted transcriptional regulator